MSHEDEDTTPQDEPSLEGAGSDQPTSARNSEAAASSGSHKPEAVGPEDGRAEESSGPGPAPLMPQKERTTRRLSDPPRQPGDDADVTPTIIGMNFRADKGAPAGDEEDDKATMMASPAMLASAGAGPAAPPTPGTDSRGPGSPSDSPPDSGASFGATPSSAAPIDQGAQTVVDINLQREGAEADDNSGTIVEDSLRLMKSGTGRFAGSGVHSSLALSQQTPGSGSGLVNSQASSAGLGGQKTVDEVPGTADGHPRTRPDPGSTGKFDARDEFARFLPQYEFMGKISEGGMGVVFKARQRALNRIVALKLLKSGAFASESLRQRFFFEAEACANLKHPNIVQIMEVGEAGPSPFYAMDYINGVPLDSFVKKNAIAWRETCRIMAEVASAVHHFHSRGIIHRDLKPDNVLIDEHGEPKIIDFGVAKSTRDDTGSMTEDGTVIGTPHYMSPEQANGQVAELDTRTDVYALGAILYALLAGQTPYHSDKSRGNLQLVLAIQREDPNPILGVVPDLPWEIVAIITKAMERERDRRYSTALEFREDLNRFLNDEPVQARRASNLYRLRKFVRRNRAVVTLSSAALVFVLATAGFLIQQRLAAARREAKLAREAKDSAERALAEQAKNAELAKKAEASAKEALALAEKAAEKDKQLAAQKLEQELERQRLAEEQKRKVEEAKLEADRRAREKALAERRAQARELLAEPRDEALVAVNNLSRALVIIGDLDKALRQEIEDAKMAVVSELARAAIDRAEVKLGEFWLGQAKSLELAAARPAVKSAIASMDSDLDALKRGLTWLAQAGEALDRGELENSKSLLDRAAGSGATNDELKALRERLGAARRERTSGLVAAARSELDAGRPSAALDKARMALRFADDPAEPTRLRDEAASRLAREARLEAARLARRPEQAARAAALLEDLVPRLAGTPVETVIATEAKHRRRAVDDSRLAGYRYIPAIEELGTAGVYVAVTEVTELDWRRFVDARGYETDALWDEECPAELRRDAARRRGRQTDEEEARRPVRGVSWFEARAYARWYARSTGLAARLPTATEWEAAAGWDMNRRVLNVFPWGERYEDGGVVPGQAAPATVGSNPSDGSPFGLLDLAGSVAEWVVAPAPAAKDRADDGPPGTSSLAAIKGGDYFADARHLRRFAQVRTLARPDPAPGDAVTRRLGLRLLVEAP